MRCRLYFDKLLKNKRLEFIYLLRISMKVVCSIILISLLTTFIKPLPDLFPYSFKMLFSVTSLKRGWLFFTGIPLFKLHDLADDNEKNFPPYLYNLNSVIFIFSPETQWFVSLVFVLVLAVPFIRLFSQFIILLYASTLQFSKTDCDINFCLIL